MARFVLHIIALALPLMAAFGFEISGRVTGGEGLSLKFIYTVPTTLDTFYVTVANIFDGGSYSQDDLAEGSYVIFAFQDTDFSLTPGIDEPRGFYGGQVPQMLEVSSDLEDIDIELFDPNSGGFLGEITYAGTETGATYVFAHREANFSGLPSGVGLLFTQNGNGDYTALVDSFGTYYAYAFMDVNTNFAYDLGEPYDVFGDVDDPEAIEIEQGEPYPDDVHFELIATSDAIELQPVVRNFSLGSPYPNPFNAQTTIPFTLDRALEIELVAHDILGRTVKTLAQGVYPAGEHAISFGSGSLASGLYMIELRAQDMSQGTQVFLLK